MIISSENGVVDLGQMAEQAMAKLVQSGKIEKMIESAIESTMKSIIGEQLKSWGDFGKAMKAVVNRSFEFDPACIRPGEYGAMIADLVQSKLRAYMVQEGEQQLATMMDEILMAAPPSIKMSDLVKELQREAVEYYDFDREKPRVTAIVEPKSKYGSRWVRLDKRPDISEYQCQVRFLLIDDGRISCLHFGEHKQEKFIGRYGGIERTLFWLHTGRTKLIIDEFDIEIPEEDLPAECHCD